MSMSGPELFALACIALLVIVVAVRELSLRREWRRQASEREAGRQRMREVAALMHTHPGNPGRTCYPGPGCPDYEDDSNE